MKYSDDVIGTGKLQNRDKRTKFSLMTKFYQFWSDFKMPMVSLRCNEMTLNDLK